MKKYDVVVIGWGAGITASFTVAGVGKQRWFLKARRWA